MYSSVKCRQCRCLIFNADECKSLFLNAHNESLSPTTENNCNSSDVIFLNEDIAPEWIKYKIEAENWSKGRINCPQCDSRIGAFNFIAGQKCTCSDFVLPFVHIIKSKVDLIR